MKKANKTPKEEKDASKKKSSLKPVSGNQKETKYVKKNFFSPEGDEDDDLDEDEDVDLDLDEDVDFDEEADVDLDEDVTLEDSFEEDDEDDDEDDF